MLCPDFILETPHRIYTHSLIKNINIPLALRVRQNLQKVVQILVKPPAGILWLIHPIKSAQSWTQKIIM